TEILLTNSSESIGISPSVIDSIVSLIISLASLRFLPYEIHPGREGTVTVNSPPASGWKRVLNCPKLKG
ncbi:MAG: hypothetical protein ACI8V7_000084, partial [Candidatus Paceibacteria bacterium]